MKCNECLREFEPKELYLIERGFNTCKDCQSVRNSFFTNGFFFTFIWKDLRQHLINRKGNVNEITLMNLTPAARAKVCNIIQEVWENQDE